MANKWIEYDLFRTIGWESSAIRCYKDTQVCRYVSQVSSLQDIFLRSSQFYPNLSIDPKFINAFDLKIYRRYGKFRSAMVGGRRANRRVCL